MQEIRLKTERRTQLVDITQRVQDALGSLNGAAAALVYIPHTTAGGPLRCRRMLSYSIMT